MKSTIKIAAIAITVFSFSACNNANQQKASETNKTDSTTNTSTTDTNKIDALVWNDTFSGILPCADCEGIKTVLKLNNDNTFTLSETYLGKKDVPFESKGNYEWNSTSKKLTVFTSGEPRYYQLVGEKLLLLDMNGEAPTGALANKYILSKNAVTTTNTTTVTPENTKPTAEIPLENTRWRLTELNGKKLTGEEAADYYIIFHSKEHRIESRVGCNQLMYSFETKKQGDLKINPGATTLMACPPNSIEDEYKNQIITVTNYSITKGVLTILKGKKAIATFVVVNKK